MFFNYFCFISEFISICYFAKQTNKKEVKTSGKLKTLFVSENVFKSKYLFKAFFASRKQF